MLGKRLPPRQQLDGICTKTSLTKLLIESRSEPQTGRKARHQPDVINSASLTRKKILNVHGNGYGVNDLNKRRRPK